MAATVGYPVRVQGRLDPSLSRWLWLVKWVLAIPHYVVLFFLWVAFLVLSVVAFFAILFTGRYPRPIFDFNVGVLRWSWRVAYYTYGALGTDRYPPFRLSDAPDYPASLAVDYPQRLSHGLVLVKWLLAFPHLLVVGLFIGGGVWVSSSWDEGAQSGTPGLIALLVLVAAVALAFTGRYPGGIFDLVLGLNRWVLRVAAYAGLMTDAYPPFRLDLGGDDPGVVELDRGPDGPPAGTAVSGAGPTTPAATATTAPEGPAAPSGGRRWTAGRVVAVVLGSLLAMFSFGLAVGGAGALAVDRLARDDAGFLGTGTEQFSTSSYALLSEDVQVHESGPDLVWADRAIGDVRLRVTEASGGPVFVGVAPAADVNRYLAGVRVDEVTDFGGGQVSYRPRTGPATPAPPEQQDFWVVSSAGPGRQAVTWSLGRGDWVLVAMNADASPGLSVDADIAAELPVLLWVAVGLLVAAVVLGGAAILVLVLALRERTAASDRQGTGPGPA